MMITFRKVTFSLRFAAFTEGLDQPKKSGESPPLPSRPEMIMKRKSRCRGAHSIPVVSPFLLCSLSSLAAPACYQQIGFSGHAQQ